MLTMFKILLVMPNYDACCDLLRVNIIEQTASYNP